MSLSFSLSIPKDNLALLKSNSFNIVIPVNSYLLPLRLVFCSLISKFVLKLLLNLCANLILNWLRLLSVLSLPQPSNSISVSVLIN